METEHLAKPTVRSLVKAISSPFFLLRKTSMRFLHFSDCQEGKEKDLYLYNYNAFSIRQP